MRDIINNNPSHDEQMLASNPEYIAVLDTSRKQLYSVNI